MGHSAIIMHSGFAGVRERWQEAINFIFLKNILQEFGKHQPAFT